MDDDDDDDDYESSVASVKRASPRLGRAGSWQLLPDEKQFNPSQYTETSAYMTIIYNTGKQYTYRCECVCVTVCFPLPLLESSC